MSVHDYPTDAVGGHAPERPRSVRDVGIRLTNVRLANVTSGVAAEAMDLLRSNAAEMTSAGRLAATLRASWQTADTLRGGGWPMSLRLSSVDWPDATAAAYHLAHTQTVSPQVHLIVAREFAAAADDVEGISEVWLTALVPELVLAVVTESSDLERDLDLRERFYDVLSRLEVDLGTGEVDIFSSATNVPAHVRTGQRLR